MMSTTDCLLVKYQDVFKKATEHELTKELCQGTLKDSILYTYLAQDLQFFETGLKLICKVTSLAPSVDSLITLAKKIGFFANDENTYFHDALELLKPAVEESRREFLGKEQIGSIKKYVGFLAEMTEDASYTYGQLVTYLWCAEEVYWKWAHDLPRAENLHWKYQTWIDLHDGEHFQVWCEFLKNEVDKYSLEEVETVFQKTLQLEYEFFEECYNA
ncbi:hypothetical protein HG537_0H03210 [Torulaspora globosa]|uniref:Thiaminase-2/PQQC domain-containing protein n=1 Tax=Torulaspora globosa TaxID=48254 RepID=A0A7H9HXV0_9SACH|nr:hypothetical protein HG537_0H03210 [Torulaspora sp. CBS 2947]